MKKHKTLFIILGALIVLFIPIIPTTNNEGATSGATGQQYNSIFTIITQGLNIGRIGTSI